MNRTIRVSQKDFFAFKIKHEGLLYSDKILTKLHTIEEDGTYVISFGEGISEDGIRTVRTIYHKPRRYN